MIGTPATPGYEERQQVRNISGRASHSTGVRVAWRCVATNSRSGLVRLDTRGYVAFKVLIEAAFSRIESLRDLSTSHGIGGWK